MSKKQLWRKKQKIVVSSGKFLLFDSCPCCQNVYLEVIDRIPFWVQTDAPQYYRCAPIGPFDYNGRIHIAGYIDDDFRIKIGGRNVYSGTELAHDFDKTFPFSAGQKIEIELVEANYKHHPTGHGGEILCYFNGKIIVCPEWVYNNADDEDFE